MGAQIQCSTLCMQGAKGSIPFTSTTNISESWGRPRTASFELLNCLIRSLFAQRRRH